MSKLFHGETLIISILLDQDEEAPGQKPLRDEVDLIQAVASKLSQLGLPATWAIKNVEDWFQHGLSDVIDEVAVLVGKSWEDRVSGRTRLAQALPERIQRIRSHGRSVSTLTTMGNLAHENLDLLIKYGIRSLCDLTNNAQGNAAHAEQIRWGLWKMPTAKLVPRRPRYRDMGNHGGGAQPSIRRTAKEHSISHLGVDLRQLAVSGFSGLGQTMRVFEMAARQRDRGKLACRNVATLTADLFAPRQANGAQSILRKAA